MRASQYTGLGIRTIMGNIVYPQSNPGITVSGTGVSVGSGLGSTAVSITGTSWVVPAVSFVQGTASNYSVLATGPGSYTAGGVYDVDPSGTSLPNPPFQLSEAGSLAYDGTGGTLSYPGVVFGYTEPNALPTLTLYPTQSGTYPYMATAYPCEGAVPSGMEIVSPDDSTLRSSVLSRWPDNSAQVVVVAGRYTFPDASTRTVRLRAGTVSNTPLTTARIGQLVTDVSVNFGTPLSIGTFNAPDRVWWANAQVICARYRIPITNKGSMEAVIDIHAFAAPENRAFIEVVIENGKTNASATTVTAPATQSYTNATVTANGAGVTLAASVSSPTASMLVPRCRNVSGTGRYQGDHTAFRAWYCSGWVGNDPQVEVTHDIASMMAHPWFFERAVAPVYSMQTNYTSTFDTYEPWSSNRLRFPRMNGGGDDQEIGVVTATQADYLISGDRYARRAVLATGLAPLSADLSIRHTDGSVPTRAQVAGKNTGAGTWPQNPEPNGVDTYLRWGGDSSYLDGSHVPAVGLVPFLCRPSPCFIELAQRTLLFHHANYNSTDGSHSYDQARSRGWRARDMATAIFLTPDSGTWNTGAEADSTRKTGYRTALVNQVTLSKSFMDQAWNTYKHIWEWELDNFNDQTGGRARFQTSMYMHQLIALSWNSVANGKVLRGTDQTMMEAAADQVMAFPIRWFTDAPSYEWRLAVYQPTVGIVSGAQINPQFSNLVQENGVDLTGTPPNAPGPWLNMEPTETNWANVSVQNVAGTGSYYPEHMWNVLCCAVERGVTNAEAAWMKVYGTSGNGGITNFSTWMAGLGNLSGSSSRAYLNRFPRNK